MARPQQRPSGNEAPGNAPPRDETPEWMWLPIWVYLATFVALVGLSGLTILASLVDFGDLSLFVALVLAVVQAGLVIGFFMHLRYDVRFTSLVFFSSLLVVAALFALTMADLTARGETVRELATDSYHDQAAAVRSAIDASRTDASQPSTTGDR